MQKHQLEQRLAAGILAVALLAAVAGNFVTSSASAISTQATGQNMTKTEITKTIVSKSDTKTSTPKLVQATKSAMKHVTAAKPHKVPTETTKNISSSVSYGNIAKSTFVKSSNHEVTLQKKSGHDQ